MMPNCPLCNGSGEVFYRFKKRLYHQCKICSGIFVDASLIPSRENEKQRYLEHNNNVEDKNYQKFVSPVTSAIRDNFTPEHSGLDFGAGTGPVISKLLKDAGYSIQLYDPFFHDFPDLLHDKYDYIACCEVIEHFHRPKTEFLLLKKLLKKNGKLFCMTGIYNEGIDFHTWYYKNDVTHVFIYHKNTLSWILKEFGFKDVFIENNFIIFYN